MYENLTDVAESLTSSNYELIGINLLVTCIAIVAVYIHSRLKKSAELREINNNFSTILDQQKVLAEETGKIKQSLDKDFVSYQIRLSSYTEKSIDAITGIYEKIIELRDSAKNLGFNPSKEEKEKFIKTVSAFRHEHDIKKIWIPDDLSKHIEEVAIEIDNRCHKFIIANTRAENVAGLSEEQMNKIFDAQEDFYDYINKEITVIFEALAKKVSNAVST